MKNKSSPKLLLTTIAIVFLTLLSGLAINLLTGNEDFNKSLKSYGIEMWHLVIGTVTIIIALIFLAYLQFKYTEKSENEKKILTEDIEPDVTKLFDSLKERYQSRYESKLDGRFEITLEVRDDFDSPNPRSISEQFGENATKGIAIEIIREAFEKKGRLLIVGNPGVGKTVLLLKLAIDLLDKIKDLEKEPFPVIFNLASWSQRKDENFGDWLRTMLVSGYGLSKTFAETLLQQERIIFLLDGLDELGRDQKDENPSEKRAKCLVSLNDYLRGGRKAVISCRIEEFLLMKRQQKQDAPVSAKVRVLNLTKDHVLDSLRHAKDNKNIKHHASVNNLLNMFEKGKNHNLLKVLRTPFYFSMAMEIFDQQILDDGQFPRDEKKLKNYLTSKFVETKLFHTPNPNNFEPKKTRNWLRWLAIILIIERRTTFELSNLQLYHLHIKSMYAFFTGIIFGILTELFFLGSVGINFWGVVGPLTFIAMLIAGFLGLFRRPIITEDIPHWSFRYIFVKWLWIYQLRSLMFIIFFSLSTAYLISLLAKIGGSSVSRFRVFLFGTLIILGWGLWLILKRLVRFIAFYADIKTPYQRFFSGVVFHVIEFLIFGTVTFFGLIYVINLTPPSYIFVFFFNIVLGFITTPLFRHLILRLCLWLERKMPLRYATFLNYATEARILEKDGGQWRFRHQNLQEYFARLDVREDLTTK